MTPPEPEPSNGIPPHKHFLHLHGHRPKERPSGSSRFSHFDITHDEFNTRAFVDHDGRIHIDFKKLKEGPLSMFLSGTDKSFPADGHVIVDEDEEVHAPPRLNIVVMVIGSRGDVQPFVAVAKVLAEQGGHRVRLATHPAFKDFVEENGVEFFDVGGDPAELMAFMVKNPVSCTLRWDSEFVLMMTGIGTVARDHQGWRTPPPPRTDVRHVPRLLARVYRAQRRCIAAETAQPFHPRKLVRDLHIRLGE